jgi:hypothetical protein
MQPRGVHAIAGLMAAIPSGVAESGGRNRSRRGNSPKAIQYDSRWRQKLRISDGAIRMAAIRDLRTATFP